MFHSRRGGWRWQETCRTWACLQSWWYCTARCYSFWPLLPLPRHSSWGLLLSRCHPCTGLLPGTWNWSPPLTSGCSCYLHQCCCFFVLLVMVLLFSVLTSIPYAVALLSSTEQRHMEWKSVGAIATTNEINVVGISQVAYGLLPAEMDVWRLWSVSCIIFSRNKLNRMGEIKHPWQTPAVVLRNSPSWLFKGTALLEFSYSA